MSIRTSSLFIVIVLMINLSSCQKEVRNAGTTDPVIPVNIADSNYLSEIYAILVDATTNQLDTVNHEIYFYDNSKRVIAIIDSSSYNTGNSEIYSNSYFFYNGSDTLPYMSKFITLDRDRDRDDTLIQYHFYNSASKKIKDSSNDFIGTQSNSVYSKVREVTVYTYLPGKICAAGYSTSIDISGTDSLYTKDTALLDGNNNVISSKKYTRPWVNSNFGLWDVSSFSYDNHPDPFIRLSSSKAFLVVPGVETLYLEMFQNNNITEVRQVNASGLEYNHEKYSYTFKPDGYLSQMIERDVTNPDSYRKLSFIYKAL